MSRPRIAVLADWWWPEAVGGAERSARSAALELARSAEVAVFVPASGRRVYADGPLTVHAVRRPFARRAHADSVLRRGLELVSAWTLPLVASGQIRALRAFRPDVVVATNISRTGPWLARWARSSGLRFVRSFHDLSDTCWRRSRRRGAENCLTVCRTCRIKTGIMRRATPATAVGVCVSEFVRTELVRADLVTPEASLVGYPLIGTTAGVRPPERPINPGGLVLGYLGRIDPTKGIESAIRTAAAYQRQSGGNVSLLVAGTGRPDYLRTLAELAAAHRLPVDFAGQLDVDTFCGRVDAVLVPSAWLEPFGRVVVEVGERGRPMLISPLGGLPEAAAVSGGRYGFADFRHPEAAGRALATLLAADPEAGPLRSEAGPWAGRADRAGTGVTLTDGITQAVHRVLATGTREPRR